MFHRAAFCSIGKSSGLPYSSIFSFLYWVGVLPFFCRNSLEKYKASSYPTDLEISLTGSSVSFSRLQALRIRKSCCS